MKRRVLLLAVFAIMAAGLSGCIISSTPDPAKPVTLKIGDSQTLAVKGYLNGSYAWYKNDTLISGASAASYAYTALAADQGTNKIKVVTRDLLKSQTLSVEWTVNVTADLPPVARAGDDQNVYFGNTVQLDGSASSDPEGQPLTYLWEIVARPAGSNAALSDPSAAAPSFTPDVEGAYTIRLIVNDGTTNSAADAVVINAYTDFVPPTAEAGIDQRVLFGAAVQLDGTASFDPEGHALTYRWTIDSGPAGSAAALDDPTSATPTFTPDMKGQYVVRLVVNDGRFDSGVDWLVITVYNTAPIADAGTDTVIADLGATAELDGTGSYDEDGTTLTYTWTITSRPVGSTAALVNPSSANPTLTPDKKGAYVVKLVVSDGDLTSEDTVVVTSSNHVPVAEAGSDFTLPFGGTVQLNGYLSSDPDGDALTYAWTVSSRPAGSTAALSSASIVNPTFTPDKKGTYVFSLVVTDNDGLASAPDYVTVVTTNHAPVANAGSDITLVFPGTTQLDGSGTDQDGDPLTYAWTIVSAPAGSTAALSNAAIAGPSFTPDRKGDYVFSLVVSDGEAISAADTVQLHVYNTAPAAEAGTDQTLPYGRTVQLDGSLSSDPEGTAVSYAWTFDSRPSGSTATIADSATATPSFTLDREGRYIVRLTVSDGDLTATDTVTVIAVEGWESGMGTWTVSNAWYGSFNKYEISTNQCVSATHAYYVEGAGLGVNQLTLKRTMTSTYVYAISFWQYWDYTSPGNSSIDTDLYINGSKFADLSVTDSDKNIWVYRTITVNQNVTSIAFVYTNYTYVDKMYIDDILVKTWN